MKKSIILLLLILLLGCSEDEKEELTLNGTVWESVETKSNFINLQLLEFDKNMYKWASYRGIVEADLSNLTNAPAPEAGGGTYEYRYPTLILATVDTAIISGTKMTLKKQSGEVIIYTKK